LKQLFPRPSVTCAATYSQPIRKGGNPPTVCLSLPVGNKTVARLCQPHVISPKSNSMKFFWPPKDRFIIRDEGERVCTTKSGTHTNLSQVAAIPVCFFPVRRPQRA